MIIPDESNRDRVIEALGLGVAMPIAVPRDVIVQAALVLDAVVYNAEVDDATRESAHAALDELNLWLLVGQHADNESVPKPIPPMLRWPAEATARVQRLKMSVPEVVEHLPAYVAMAELAARHCDNEGAGLPFRLDSLETLEMLLRTIKEHIADRRLYGEW